MTIEGRASTNLQKALEEKLSKIGGPTIRKIIQSNIQSDCDFDASCSYLLKSNVVVAPAGGIFEIADKSVSPNGFLGKFLSSLKRPGRVKNIVLICFFFSLAAVLIFVRKRQLIKRILSSLFRRMTLAALPAAPDYIDPAVRAVGATSATLIVSN